MSVDILDPSVTMTLVAILLAVQDPPWSTLKYLTTCAIQVLDDDRKWKYNFMLLRLNGSKTLQKALYMKIWTNM